MKTILKQIKNEWSSNLFLFVELLLVFVVLWYIVDWTLGHYTRLSRSDGI